MAFDGKQIRNATVVGAKLVNATITDAQLATDAVTTAKIINAAVDAAKLASNAVIEAKIADAAVSTGKLADGSVTTVKLAANAIDATKLADGSVTLAKLAADSVDSSKIKDGSITGADIASNTIAAANLLTAYETTLLLRDGSRAMTGALDLGAANKIVNLSNPTQAQDAATKAYVDSVASSLDLKSSVRAATTANIALSATTTAVDGVTLATNDRVLVKNQTNASENGIWAVPASGPWARAADANADAEVTSGLFTFVEEGATNGNTGWVLTTSGTITVGTTNLAFTQFSGAGSYLAGFGLTLSGNVFAVNFNDADGTITEVGTTQDAGVSNKVARADHSHALADGAVSGAVIADGSITTAKLADDAITGDKIADGAVGEEQLDPNLAFNIYYTDGSHALAGDMDAAGYRIGNLAYATNDNEAATVLYVKNNALSKEPVYIATTEAIDIAALTNTGADLTIDGVAFTGGRILVKDQASKSENGVYHYGGNDAAWVRPDDFNGVTTVRLGTNVFVEAGATNKGTTWTLTGANGFSQANVAIPGSDLTFSLASGREAVADGATNNNITDSAGVAGSLGGERALKIDALPFGYEGKARFDVDLNTHKIKNLTDPAAAQDAATKAYVDAQIVTAGGGLDTSNIGMTASVTTADGDEACATSITSDAKGYVQVYVNGLKVNLTGDLDGDCYFSADGTNARALNGVRADDKLYWNGSNAEYELAGTDIIDFCYIAQLA